MLLFNDRLPTAHLTTPCPLNQRRPPFWPGAALKAEQIVLAWGDKLSSYPNTWQPANCRVEHGNEKGGVGWKGTILKACENQVQVQTNWFLYPLYVYTWIRGIYLYNWGYVGYLSVECVYTPLLLCLCEVIRISLTHGFPSKLIGHLNCIKPKSFGLFQLFPLLQKSEKCNQFCHADI